MNRKDHIPAIHLQNTEVYNAVFVKYYASLCVYGKSILKNRDDAEDVVTDLFARLWNRPEPFLDEEHLKAHLYRSTKNACIDFIRRYTHSAERNAVFLADVEQIEQDYLHEMIKHEVIRELHQAIATLSAYEQRIMNLSLEGKSNQEIADTLGLALQTVKNKKLRALAQLRKLMSKEQFNLMLLLPFLRYFGDYHS